MLFRYDPRAVEARANELARQHLAEREAAEAKRKAQAVASKPAPAPESSPAASTIDPSSPIDPWLQATKPHPIDPELAHAIAVGDFIASHPAATFEQIGQAVGVDKNRVGALAAKLGWHKHPGKGHQWEHAD